MSYPYTRALSGTTLAAAMALAASSASAQDFDSVRTAGAPREGGRVGVVAVAGPVYKGSDERRAALLPVVEYRWANGFFAGLGSGVGYEFLREPGTVAGVRLTPDMGRKESRANALKGMGDIGARAEVGLYLNHSLPALGLGLSSNLRYGAGGDGLLLDLGLAHGFPIGPGMRVRLGMGMTLANGAYMQRYYGVTAAQAATSGYQTTQAGAGVRDVRASLGLLWAITPKLAFTGGVSGNQLMGDAAESPLTRQRSGVSFATTLTFGF